METVGEKKSVASRSYRGARDREAEHRGFSRCETILYDTIMTTCHCTFAKTHRLHNTKMNLNVNYRFWIIGSSVVGKKKQRFHSGKGMLITGETMYVRVRRYI